MESSQQSSQQVSSEVVQSLERSYQERFRELTIARETLAKAQESVINAQDAAFRAYKLLAVNKEQHLINLITSHQKQSEAYAAALSEARRQPKPIPPAPDAVASVVSVPNVEARADNIEVATSVSNVDSDAQS